ncbi:MAG TPA: hypothetical protein VF990_13880 [Candidatus Dormibacteraeota bacterium]
MRLRGWRLPARIGLAAVVTALALPIAAAPVQAAANPLTMTVHVGYQDVVKTGGWMPVTIDARNSGAGVDGMLEVQESLNAQPGVSGFTVYEEPISLASGASKRVRLYLVENTTGATITARITQQGRVVVSQDSAAGSTTSALIGVLSDQSVALDDFAAVHPGGIAARVVHLRPDDIPDSAISLRAFDILVIDDFATDSLTAGQRAAIGDYVATGGDLLVGTGAAWRKTLAALPPAILPMQVTGTTVVDSATAGGSAVEVATGTVTNGVAWLSDAGRPLILERPYGAGTVTMSTFDWNQQPVAVASDSRAILRQVMSRAFFGQGGATQNVPYAAMGPVPMGFGSQPSISTKSSVLTPVLGNLPGLDLPSLQLTGALVLIYVLLVGPVNYLVLGAMRRRALAWVTVPLIALLAAAGSYGAGVFTKGRSVQSNQIAILHVQPGSDHAYQETYTGIIPPSRGDYQASAGGERLLISPIATNNGYAYAGSVRVNVTSNQVTLSGMTAFALGGFATEGVAVAPKLTAHVALVNGQLKGTVENHSNVTFTDAVLIAGDSFQTIGALRPGATASLSLTPKTATSLGQPLYMRIYNQSAIYQGGYGPGGPTTTAADRDNFAKSQIMSLLPTGVGFKGTSADAAPMLVAWTHQSFQDLSVNGSRPRSTALGAVVLSLPVDQIGTGPLPAGVVSGRIVDVVGDSQGQGPPGMLVLQNGSVTYEFAPALTGGAHLTGVSINATNPYGPKSGPPGTTTQTGPAVTGQVWDWTHATWTDVAYQDNGTTTLPDSAADPSSGLIRLRLTTTNGGLLAGSISLSGTVQ